jgi:hypothetical protein
MDPRTHQRDVGERERYPPQPPKQPNLDHAAEAGARAKSAKNNKDHHDQTARAISDAGLHRRGKSGEPDAVETVSVRQSVRLTDGARHTDKER